MDDNLYYSWNDIKASLGTLSEPLGGYTSARRGIVTLPSGGKLFVKIGRDDSTKQWARKEIAVYRFLHKQKFPFVPKLLAVNQHETAFAIEPLQADWDWSDVWTTKRLGETLSAMDALAQIVPKAEDRAIFEKSFVSETADGWRHLAKQTNPQEALRRKLVSASRSDIAYDLNFAWHAQQSEGFLFRRTELVHNDVRADNCAWSEDQQMVKFIDWNWAQLGDRRIDVNAFLVHVHKTGFDITEHLSRLDKEALHWLAGFWFNAAIQPILDGGSEHTTLRDHQLMSGIAAFDLAKSL